jgi:hypothetical protein
MATVPIEVMLFTSLTVIDGICFYFLIIINRNILIVYLCTCINGLFIFIMVSGLMICLEKSMYLKAIK